MRLTARTAGSLAVLALLVGACVFAAMTGPAVSLRTRTQALSQTLAATKPTTRTVQVEAPWDDFTAYITTGFYGVGEPLTSGQLTQTQREIGRGLASLSLPLAAGAWTGLTTHALPIASGTGPRAFYMGDPPQMQVVYRNTLPANAELVAGGYAHGALPRGALAGTVTTQTAARFGLHAGSHMMLTLLTGPVRVVITAIVQMRGPASAFWMKDSTVGVPSLVTGRYTCNCWTGSILADPDQAFAMQQVFAPSRIDMQWVYPLVSGGLSADGVPSLLAHLNRASTAPVALTGAFAAAANTAGVTAPLVPVLSAFLDTQAAVQTVLLLLFVSLIVAAPTYLVLPGAWYVATGAISGLVAAFFLAEEK